MSVLWEQVVTMWLTSIHTAVCSVPRFAPLLNSLIDKQLTGAPICSSVPIAAQAVTDGLAEAEDVLVT